MISISLIFRSNPHSRLRTVDRGDQLIETRNFSKSWRRIVFNTHPVGKVEPVVPDFVIKLRSATDRLGDVRKKMVEYQRLGVKLGLLINPQDKQVDVYELGIGVKTCQSPTSIDCGSVMPGFELSLTEIW